MFTKTSLAIADSEKLITENDLRGQTVEYYLAQYIMVCLNAEIQTTIFMKLKEISESLPAKSLNEYINNASGRLIRSFNKKELSGFLGSFGKEYKTHFNSLLAGKERDVTLYGELVDARHNVTHGSGSNKTFREIKKGVEASEIIINAFLETFNIIIQDSVNDLGNMSNIEDSECLSRCL